LKSKTKQEKNLVNESVCLPGSQMPGRWRISKTASKSVTLKIVKADASEE
jgi:hypothetical protein